MKQIVAGLLSVTAAFILTFIRNQLRKRKHMIYYLDQADDGEWLIKFSDKKYRAGRDKELVLKLITRLNTAHRPNLHEQGDGIAVCWNDHKKGESCDYVLEIKTKK